MEVAAVFSTADSETVPFSTTAVFSSMTVPLLFLTEVLFLMEVLNFLMEVLNFLMALYSSMTDSVAAADSNKEVSEEEEENGLRLNGVLSPLTHLTMPTTTLSPNT